MATGNRSYAVGSFLELEGVKCGFVKSVDGGAISAEVVTERTGADLFDRKHIGPPRYEEFVLQLGLSMDQVVYDWISAMWAAQPARKSGAIVAADVNMVARSRHEFREALITEVTIPACDAGAKDPVFLTVKFAPELTRQVKASGKVSGELDKRMKKLWLPANFRLEIEGLECRKASKVDALTVRQAIASDEVGDTRDYQREPTAIEFPNLRITLAESDAQSWVDWHEDFVVKGNNDESREKNGALVFLSPDLKTELIRISFANLGIFRLAPAMSAGEADAIQRFTAELYCERMEFLVSDKAAPAAPRSATPARSARRTKARRAR